MPYHLFRTLYLNNLDKLRRVSIGCPWNYLLISSSSNTQSKINPNFVAVVKGMILFSYKKVADE